MHIAVPVAITALFLAPAGPTASPYAPKIEAAQVQAQAQSTAAAPVPAVAPAAGPQAASTPASPRPPYRRLTLLQRFDEANTTKDGHLTQSQAATVHWTYITRNFETMDKARKGYVTVDDIREFARERRAARQTQPGASRARG